MDKIQKIGTFLWIKTCIFDNPELDGSDIMVYATLMRYMNNESKECYPSIKTLSTKARLSRNTVYQCLDKLEALSLIYRKRSRGKVNRYVLLEPVPNTGLLPKEG